MQERLFHFIKQRRTGDSFTDLLQILKSGFLGYGRAGLEGYANAIKESTLSWHDKMHMLDALAMPSKMDSTYDDCYAIELDIEEDLSYAEHKDWRALRYVPINRICHLYVRLPPNISREETVDRIKFYRRLGSKHNLDLSISKTPKSRPFFSYSSNLALEQKPDSLPVVYIEEGEKTWQK